MGRGEEITEKELLEESRRFNQILEYIQYPGSESLLTDDDSDPNVDPNADQNGAQSGPDAGSDMGGAPDISGDSDAMGAPDMGAGPDAAAMRAPDMGGGPNAMGDDTSAGPEGFDPQPGAGDVEAAETDQPGPNDNVIDIDDLTAAQDEINAKVEGLDGKFTQLMGTIDKFLKTIEANDGKIAALKQEIEKRNPTPVEKLDLRSVNDSFPYNVKPTDYWAEKEATSNYRVGGDDKETPEQYELHQSDIDNTTDWKAVSDSLDDDDFITNLTKILNY